MSRRLIALGLLLSLCAAAPLSIASRPISRLDTPWWRQRFEAKQAALHHGPVDLLWLGDSITQDWERTSPQPWKNFATIWKRFYGDRHAVNLGFRGDSTCHLLWRLEHGELNGIVPKAAILLIGANNFGHVHTDAAQTYGGIVTILNLIHRRQPHMQVLLLGVLPSIRSAWVTRNTARLDGWLPGLPQRMGPWLHYQDVGAALEHDGHVDPARFLDPHLVPPDPPLHPDAEAQAQIAGMIEPTVAAMLGDHLHH